MPESESHKRAKKKAAGKTESKLSDGRRIDSASPKRATEVERSGTKKGLENASKRLKDSGKDQKVLQVPQKDMKKAVEAMENIGVTGSVKNIGGTKRTSVKKKKGKK